MTGALISLSQQQVAAVLKAGLADPAGIIAVTGEAGLGKTATVTAVIREAGMTAWFISPELDDISVDLALLYKAKSLANMVLVIEDAHTMAIRTLKGLFALLDRDRRAFPRVVFVARPEFWQRFDDPTLAEARDRIRTVAVLFPLDPAESERFLCRGLGTTSLSSWAHTLVQDAQGNPRRLAQGIADLGLPVSRDQPRSQPRRPRLSTSTVSGVLALLVLVLAMVALVVWTTEPSPSIFRPGSASNPVQDTPR